MDNRSPSVISHAKRTGGDEEVLDLLVVDLQGVGPTLGGVRRGGVNRIFLITGSTCHVPTFNSVHSPPHLLIPCLVSPSPTDVCLGAGELLTTCD